MIFARPGFFGTSIVPIIMESTGTFVGQIPIESWFAARLSPGKHTLIVFVHEQHVMQADLEAGRIYVVEVPITFRISVAGTGRPNLCLVRPSDRAWQEATSWLGMRRLEPMVAEGQKLLDRFRTEISVRIEDGFWEAAELDESDTCRRRIAPADGVAAPLPIPLERTTSD